jgi:hypothetical protein
MKKIFFMIMVTIISAFVLVSSAMAIDIGTYCWDMQPFPDNIEVAVVNQGSNYGIYGILRNPTAAAGIFFEDRPGPYSIAIYGAAAPDGIHGEIDLALTIVELVDPHLPIEAHFHAKLYAGLHGLWKLFESFSGMTSGGYLTPMPCPIP